MGACVFRTARSEVRGTDGYNKTRISPARTISNQGIQRAEGYGRRVEGAGERGQRVNRQKDKQIIISTLQAPTEFHPLISVVLKILLLLLPAHNCYLEVPSSYQIFDFQQPSYLPPSPNIIRFLSFPYISHHIYEVSRRKQRSEQRPN